MTFSLYFCMASLPLLMMLSISMPRILAFAPVIYMLCFLGEMIYRKIPRPVCNVKLLIAVLCFLCVYATSAFWAFDPEMVLKRTFKLALVFIPGVFLISWTTTISAGMRQKLMTSMPTAFVVTSLIYVIEILLDYPFYRMTRGVADDVFVYAFVTNAAAVLLVFLFWPILAGVCIGDKTRHIKIRQASLMTMSLAVVMYLTTSQSAFLATILGAVAFLCVTFAPRIFKAMMMILLPLGGFLAPWIAIFLFQLRPDFLIQWKMSNAAQRMEIWDFVSDRILQSPWLGYGGEATRHIKDFQSDQIFFPRTEVLHPHNAILQLWIELGVIGAIFGVIALLYGLLKSCDYDMAQRGFVVAAYVSIVTVALVGYGLWQGWLLGAMVLTMMLFAFLKNKNEST